MHLRNLCRRSKLFIFAHSLARQVAMPSVAELKSRAAELRSQSKLLEEKVRRLHRQASTDDGPPPATTWMRVVAMHLFVLRDFNAEVALEYLAFKKRRADAGEVSAWYRALSADDRISLMSPPGEDLRAARQLAEARKFFAEKKLVNWVREQNESKGIAPSPGAVLDHAAHEVGFRGKRNERRRLLRRIMDRWGARKCLLGGGDRLTEAALREKAAGTSFVRRCRKSRPKNGPVLGTAWRSRFWDRCVNSYSVAREGGRQAVRFSGPFLGLLSIPFLDFFWTASERNGVRLGVSQGRRLLAMGQFRRDIEDGRPARASSQHGRDFAQVARPTPPRLRRRAVPQKTTASATRTWRAGSEDKACCRHPGCIFLQ